MPWQETEPMKERMRFVVQATEGYFTVSELCICYGVSRKTGYKWLNRFDQEGLAGLSDRSRAPHRVQKTSAEVEALIVSARLKHPRWGPRKLRAWLKSRDPEREWPAGSTFGGILKRNGLIKSRRRRRQRQPNNPLNLSDYGSGEVMTVDFKGQFRMGNTLYCYPLTMSDYTSRFLCDCKGLDSVRSDPARQQFIRVFRRYGLPAAILSDNGVPFAGLGLARLSRLSVWWIRLGIEPLLIQPGCPQQNGRHERMHRTLKAATARPPQANLEAQQRAFDRFRHEYNQQRPHEALGNRTPAEFFRSSPRPYPEQLPSLQYPGHYELRKVDSAGLINWRTQRFFLTTVLSGEHVGLEEIDDGIFSVYFGFKLIGRLDERQGRFYG